MIGVVMCLVALLALSRILSVTSGQRIERGKEAIVGEIAILATSDPEATLDSTPVVGALGLRGGFVDAGRLPNGIDPNWMDAFEEARVHAAATNTRSVAEVRQTDAELLVAVAPSEKGGFVWVGMVVQDPQYLRMWQAIVAVIAASTLLLVVTSFTAVSSVRRGAGDLKGSLASLASDLDAPVARPPLKELAEVADGISDLARALANSERERDSLRTELAHRERLAALGRVVAGVAHEVRNPLAAIKLRLDLAAADPVLSPTYQREFARTSDEIDRLDRLVRDLLLVAGQRRVAVARASLGDLVGERVELLQPWAKERGIELSCRGQANAEVAKEAVARAVDNLIRNAIEASPTGTEVKVEVAKESGQAVVRVEDHGPGVDPARAGELFEPFFTTKSEGTGLGLAISRAIANAHSGALIYHRECDATCFELSLGKALT
jgi:signal transduction histidine kinase